MRKHSKFNQLSRPFKLEKLVKLTWDAQVAEQIWKQKRLSQSLTAQNAEKEKSGGASAAKSLAENIPALSAGLWDLKWEKQS